MLTMHYITIEEAKRAENFDAAIVWCYIESGDALQNFLF